MPPGLRHIVIYMQLTYINVVQGCRNLIGRIFCNKSHNVALFAK